MDQEIVKQYRFMIVSNCCEVHIVLGNMLTQIMKTSVLS